MMQNAVETSVKIIEMPLNFSILASYYARYRAIPVAGKIRDKKEKKKSEENGNDKLCCSTYIALEFRSRNYPGGSPILIVKRRNKIV